MPRESLRLFLSLDGCVVALQCCVSAVWHSARSYTSTHTPPLLGFPSRSGHHRALRRAPCAFSRLSLALFSAWSCLSVPIPRPIALLPSHLSHLVFSRSVCLYALQITSSVLFFSLYSTYKQYYIKLVFLTSLCMAVSRFIHVSANGTVALLFMAE